MKQIRYRIHLFRVPVRWLETVLRIPFLNYRIGLSTLLGAVPFVGTTVVTALALYPVILASQVPELPPDVFRRMIFNMVLGGALGMVPFVGGLLSNIYRPTTRNIRLLDRWVTKLEVAVPLQVKATL